MKSWEILFDNAMTQIKAANIPSDKWTFGGGTSLMHKFNHRDSKDIDIFVVTPQLLSFLTPRLNDAIDHLVGRYDEQSNFIRIYLEQGEIDFIHSAPVTTIPPTKEIIRGFELLVDDPTEIVAKKVFYRSDEFKSRDIFDLAVVYSKQKNIILQHADFFGPHLEQLIRRTSLLSESGQLERDCSELALLPYGKQLRGSELPLFNSFIADVKRELVKYASINIDQRCDLTIPREDIALAKAFGLEYDFTSKTWFTHKNIAFDIPERWGGCANNNSIELLKDKSLKEETELRKDNNLGMIF